MKSIKEGGLFLQHAATAGCHGSGRAKCNKASLCYRKHKGNHGHRQERRLSWGKLHGSPPGPSLGSGSDSQGDFMGLSVPVQGLVGQEALGGPAMSVNNAGMPACHQLFPLFLWKHLEEVLEMHHPKRGNTHGPEFVFVLTFRSGCLWRSPLLNVLKL